MAAVVENSGILLFSYEKFARALVGGTVKPRTECVIGVRQVYNLLLSPTFCLQTNKNSRFTKYNEHVCCNLGYSIHQLSP